MRNITWEKVKNYLNKVKVSSETLETVRKLTGPFRHEARVEEVLNEVNNYYEINNLQDLDCYAVEVFEDGEVNEIKNPFYKEGLIKALVCYFDYLGVYGGGLKNPGSGTSRLLKVGKGRRHASDGSAYLSATLTAVERLLRIYFGIKYTNLTFKVFESEVFVGFKFWFISVKDLIKAFPEEVKQTLIFVLIKTAYSHFNGGFLNETDLLNVLADLSKILDELIKVENLVGSAV